MNAVELLGRAILALGLVLTVMWLIARWARRPLSGKSERVLTVLARQQLSKGSSVAVIKVADRALVLGVTDSSVQLLTETDLDTIQETLLFEQLLPSKRRRKVMDSTDTSDVAADPLDEAARVLSGAPAGALVGVKSLGSHKARPLDGSVLSPAVWKQVVSSARDLTVRR